MRDYLRFYLLARKRTNSHNSYYKFESQQAKMVIKGLEKQGVNFNGKLLLDLGCGRGGYSRELKRKGAVVISTDITNKYFQGKDAVQFLYGDATKLPFHINSFDIIFCSGMIEHVKQQKKVIQEIRRVLAPGGYCYLSFPPFWSPVGSHQYKPFHYFGEKIAIKLSRKLYKVRSLSYNDKYGTLYITTINKIKQLINNEGLIVKKILTRFSPINFARIPYLNEILTWHVEFLITKPAIK